MKRKFKGIWIPASIYVRSDINPTEKIFLSEIDFLSDEAGCNASNSYLAEFLQLSEGSLKNMITKLKDMGFIRIEKSSGKRILILENQFSSDIHKATPISKNENGEGQKDGSGCPSKKILELFNELCPSLSSIRNIAGKRLKAVRARWKECEDDNQLKSDPLNGFCEVFKKAEASDFLTGRDIDSRPDGRYKDFTASFDWLMTETYFWKVMEGGYPNKRKIKRRQKGALREGIDY